MKGDLIAHARKWRPAIWADLQRWHVLAMVARHRRLHGDQWDEIYMLAVIADLAQEARWERLRQLALRGLVRAGGMGDGQNEVAMLEAMADVAHRMGHWVEAVRLAEHAGAIEAIGPMARVGHDAAVREAMSGRARTALCVLGMGDGVSSAVLSNTIEATVRRLRWLPGPLADYLSPISLLTFPDMLMPSIGTLVPRERHGLSISPFLIRWIGGKLRRKGRKADPPVEPGLQISVVPAEGDIVFEVSDGATLVEGGLGSPRNWIPEGFCTSAGTFVDELYRFHRNARLQEVETVRASGGVLHRGGLLVGEILGRLPAAGEHRTLTVRAGGVFAALPWPAFWLGDRYLIETFDIRFEDGLSPQIGAARAPRLVALSGTSPSMADEAAAAVRQARASRFPADAPIPLSRESLMGALSTATIVHIASHIAAHPHDPHRSRIQMADGEWTEVGEIADGCAGVDLLFLAGCESGSVVDDALGSDADGTRPWRLAGVASVVSTLWRISDRHAPILADRFYARLFAGEGRAAALAGAQRDALRDADLFGSAERFIDVIEEEDVPIATMDPAHPRIWGGFRLTGAGGPIRLAGRDAPE